MADLETRRRQRRAEATGDPSDQLELFRRRVRNGEITRAGLILAAYCGHPEAVAILGDLRRPTLISSRGRQGGMARTGQLGPVGRAAPGDRGALALGAWLVGLADHDEDPRGVCVRAAHLVGEYALRASAPPSDEELTIEEQFRNTDSETRHLLGTARLNRVAQWLVDREPLGKNLFGPPAHAEWAVAPVVLTYAKPNLFPELMARSLASALEVKGVESEQLSEWVKGSMLAWAIAEGPANG